MGDWYRVLYRGSWSAPGTREAFHGSNALIGCARFSSSSLYIILPIPEWSLNFDSSSISLVILGSSGGISSSSSSVSPRLFRRCLTTKTSTVIQTQMFIKYTQQQFNFVSDFTWCVSWTFFGKPIKSQQMNKKIWSYKRIFLDNTKSKNKFVKSVPFLSS